MIELGLLLLLGNIFPSLPQLGQTRLPLNFIYLILECKIKKKKSIRLVLIKNIFLPNLLLLFELFRYLVNINLDL